MGKWSWRVDRRRSFGGRNESRSVTTSSLLQLKVHARCTACACPLRTQSVKGGETREASGGSDPEAAFVWRGLKIDPRGACLIGRRLRAPNAKRLETVAGEQCASFSEKIFCAGALLNHICCLRSAADSSKKITKEKAGSKAATEERQKRRPFLCAASLATRTLVRTSLWMRAAEVATRKFPRSRRGNPPEELAQVCLWKEGPGTRGLRGKIGPPGS